MIGGARMHRRLEIASTVLLALATIATAWAAYQSRQWSGTQSESTAKATADRIAENRAAALANRQVEIDVATFVQWLDARARHEPQLARFYRRRFRPEFERAFATWLAARPFGNGAAPPTPFATRAYRLKANAEADALERAAAAKTERAKTANQRAENYMLAVVLFAIALFFAGISNKMESEATRAVVLGMGCVVFLGAAIYLATFPVQLTT